MSETIRLVLIVLCFTFVAAEGYDRVQSERSGEQLDRAKEGRPILIGIRLLGLMTILLNRWYSRR